MAGKYSDYASLRECAAAIVRECILRGRSDGWCGTREDQEKIEAICDKFGVIYADDFHGTWEPKKDSADHKGETE